MDDHCPQDNAIKVEYHPSSGQESRTFTPEDFFIRAASLAANPSADSNPWAPFRTREDFEFAELVLNAGMPKGQVNALIRLFHKCIENGRESFTFSNYNEMQKTLAVASERLPKVFLQTIMNF